MIKMCIHFFMARILSQTFGFVMFEGVVNHSNIPLKTERDSSYKLSMHTYIYIQRERGRQIHTVYLYHLRFSTLCISHHISMYMYGIQRYTHTDMSNIYIYIHMYIHIYTDTHTHVYIYIYRYTYTHIIHIIFTHYIHVYLCKYVVFPKR